MAKKNLGPRREPFAKKKVKHRNQIVDDFMDRLPNMTANEIRRHRIDYFKALCLELEEEGYNKASRTINYLIELEETQRNAAEPGSVILFKPLLKDQHIMLDALQSGLRQAEKEEKSGQSRGACTVFLNLAIYFQDKGANWYHIADEFFNKSCENGEKYVNDGRRIAAMASYSYGKFLMENMKNESKALNVLETTQNISNGKSWFLPDLKPIDPSRDIPKNSSEKERETVQDEIWARELVAKDGTVGTLYEETCTLLYKLFFQMAKNIKEQGSDSSLDIAVQLCHKSLKNAEKSGKVNLKAEALKELGLCYMEKEDFHFAVTYFEKLLQFSSQRGIQIAICEAHQQLGHVYETLKDPIKALYHFDNFCKATNHFETTHLRGRSYRCLGVFHLTQGNSEEAVEYLEKAFNECHLQKQKEGERMQEVIKETHKASSSVTKSLKYAHEPLKEATENIIDPEIDRELERTRVLLVIAEGFQQLPLYSQLVMKSSEDHECMKILMQWRNCGKPFWKSSLKEHLSKISLEPKEFDIVTPAPYPPSVVSSDFPSGDECCGYTSEN